MSSFSDSPIGGSTASLTVYDEITVDGKTYVFIFWNVNAVLTPPHYTGTTPDPVQAVTFLAPNDDSTFDATAWYILGGVGGSGGVVYAFSQNQDKELSNSPIGTIIPASAQTGPNTFSTTTSVVVTAPAVIVGYGRFNQWLPLLEPPVDDPPVNDPVLTVAAKGAIVAIASYGIPVPDPCQVYRDELQNIDCNDFPTVQDCVKYGNSIRVKLIGCEKQYGENPNPLP